MRRPKGGPERTPDPQRRRFITWLWRLPVVAAALAGGWAGFRAYQIHFREGEPAITPEFVPLEPRAIAPLSAFGEVWDAVTFTAGSIPGITIRLPELVPGGLTVDT